MIVVVDVNVPGIVHAMSGGKKSEHDRKNDGLRTMMPIA